MGAPRYSRGAGGENIGDSTYVKTEDSDTEMADSSSPTSALPDPNGTLPPQLLVLVLERGDLVFLFLHQGPRRSWDFVSSTQHVPGQRLVCPGFHMAIDPSSRFLALACSENLFIMYHLESMETLREQYSRDGTLQPIKEKVARAVKGIIHKIEFLHPHHGNEYQIILLIIVVQPEVSRLAVYEWDRRLDMTEVFLEERNGYRLEENYRMPLLVVPLKVRNAFLMITERITATCSDILSGPPEFVPFDLANRDDTELHHGTREPLWTAWTRPIRHPPYHDKKDVIYLAREDGLINFLECGDESEIETSVSMGSVDCNIDTAFASLFHPFGDVLVTGGDSGPGAVWNVEARQSPQRIGSIPNWSPTVDFAVTNAATGEEHEDNSATSCATDNRDPSSLQPGKVFACSGRGILGAITEFRYGIQARIGLDLSYSSNIRRCWAISPYMGAAEDGFFLLLALPNESSVLHLSGDLNEVSELDHDAIPYDLSSTTLTAQEADGVVVQVTTTYITIVTPTACSQFRIGDIIHNHTAVVADAAIRGDSIALAVYSSSEFKIALLSIDGLQVSSQRVFDIGGEVTCLAVDKLAGNDVILAGLWQGESSTLAVYHTKSTPHVPASPILVELRPGAGFNPGDPAGGEVVGALTSIVHLGDRSGKAIIAVGTRDGYVITTQLGDGDATSHEICWDKLSVSPSHVLSGSAIGDPNSLLVCSDAELAIVTNYTSDSFGTRFEGIHRVWPTDGDRPSMPSPPINFVAELRRPLIGYGESILVMVSGARIMITELQRRPKLVPRYFPVEGTPVKIMFSPQLEALITVVSKNGRPSLHFLDPTTGRDLSQPLERRKSKEAYTYYEVDYITGLGSLDTRAISLTTWSYRCGGVHGDWIVLALRRRANEGLLLIISAEPDNTSTQTGMPRLIRFWTKFDRKIRDGPIWSVATDEHGVFLCVGNLIQYHIIEQGKFRVVRQCELPSPASWMQVVNGRLHALTTKHSLVVLDYKSEPSFPGEQMSQLHTDDTCRSSLHSIEVGSSLNTITMLSDPMCGVHGLWTPPENERPLQLIFRAELQASIRRFARGYTRALWGTFKNRPRYGCIRSGPAGSDILGLTIDGSLQHFTLLDENAWRLLRFIQNVAATSPAICPYISSRQGEDEVDPEPRFDPKLNMQVDGDVLKRCLDKRALEMLMSEQHAERFRELLGTLDKEGYLSSREGPGQDTASYELGYSILTYYLSPVL
ncbi:hypothetical protein GGS23DRAFT_573700 [Durotheca rogersii]|uniref:uncharacterized protein n=1 Tax=Durotheca rogersii TaxID=419775 RepID=UPI0022209EC5|nr:uncharacterized protein GGS23DRAFT_573700 [Durotheca rogersii]KAI5861897.1 hypothetical protein GGS23DRAFT_573700 [Durotheca rogersii]